MAKPLRGLLNEMTKKELQTLAKLARANKNLDREDLIDSIIEEIKEALDFFWEYPNYKTVLEITAARLGVRYDKDYDDAFDLEVKITRRVLKKSLINLSVSNQQKIKENLRVVAMSASQYWDQGPRDRSVGITSTVATSLAGGAVTGAVAGPLGTVLAIISGKLIGSAIKSLFGLFGSKPKVKKLIRCIVFLCLMRRKYQPEAADYSKLDKLLT